MLKLVRELLGPRLGGDAPRHPTKLLSRLALLPDLWQGKLDLVVGRLPPRHSITGLDDKELLEEPVALLTGREHPLAQNKKVA